MKKSFLIITMIAAFVLVTAGCLTIPTQLQTQARDDSTSPNAFCINTTNYYIHEITSSNTVGAIYEYEIRAGNTVLASETNMVEQPYISDLGEGIIRLIIGDGTNHKYIQYFDIYRVAYSDVFMVPSIFSDYVDTNDNHLLSYFDYSSDNSTILKILDIFDSAYVIEIGRDFISPVTGADQLMFISENEIYVNYSSASHEGKSTQKREMICFGDVELPIITTYADGRPMS